MNLWKAGVLVVVLAILGWGIYSLASKNLVLQKQADELGASFKKLEDENNYLASQIKYFERPENLLKELKSQFNYREAGEKLIIIVPNQATSTSTTGTNQ